MNETLQQLADQYIASLQSYLQGAQQTALRNCYELGRAAVAQGVGIQELVSAQYQALAAVAAACQRRDPGQLALEALPLFAESFSAYEVVLCKYREANSSLRMNLLQLQAAERKLQRQNQELAAAHRMVESQRQRYQNLFHFAPGGYLVTDLDGVIQEANDPVARLLGDGSPAGYSFPEMVVEEEREALRRQIARLRTGEAERIEDWQLWLERPGGGSVHVSLRVEVVRDAQGRSTALRWLMTDITERQRLEEERAQLRIREHLLRAERESAQRMKFLAEASAALAVSLNYSTIVSSIARLAVPYLADCCMVHLAEDAASVQQVSIAHADADLAGAARRLERCCAAQKRLPEPLARVLAGNHSELIPEIPTDWLESLADIAAAADILGGLGLRSAVVAPMAGHARPLGVITLMRSAAHGAFTKADQELADDFARRCSLVLDNAMLYSQVVVERDKAGKLSRAKDEFVAVLSHELRTPLTGILGWARIFKKQPVVHNDALLKEGVHALEHNAKNVARLVEDCLDITRIAQRRITLQEERVDINDAVRATLEAAREAVGEKDLHLAVHLAQTPLWVLGDRTRLEQVLSNLFSNAVRYTGKGGVVSVSARRAGSEVLVSVRDTGIGIAPDLLDQIFQPFRQGTPQWLQSESGLGLGLAISRELVRMHGGTVWAESRGPDQGSTFYVRLPLAAAQIPGTAAPAAGAPEAHSAIHARVLLVEDSLEILNLLRMELTAEGFSILTATDARSGLEIARRECPDAVVSDIKMPGMDGYEFMTRLRQIPELAGVPAVALTGFGMKQDVEKALAAGYNVHLCKPVEMEQLTGLIRELVSRRSSVRLERSPASPAKPAAV